MCGSQKPGSVAVSVVVQVPSVSDRQSLSVVSGVVVSGDAVMCCCQVLLCQVLLSGVAVR